MVSDCRLWKVGWAPGGPTGASGRTGNYTVKVQRGRFPGAFKGWEEVQLAGPGPPVREGDERKGLAREPQPQIAQGLDHAAVSCRRALMEKPRFRHLPPCCHVESGPEKGGTAGMVQL